MLKLHISRMEYLYTYIWLIVMVNAGTYSIHGGSCSPNQKKAAPFASSQEMVVVLSWDPVDEGS